MRKASVLLILLFVAGCGMKKDALVGSWTGQLTMSEAALEGAAQQAKITSGGIEVSKETIREMVEKVGSSLMLNADDTFSMNLGPATYTGTWQLKSQVVSLKIETILGLPIEEAVTKYKMNPLTADQLKVPMKLNVADGGKSLSGASPDDPGSKVTFKKQ